MEQFARYLEIFADLWTAIRHIYNEDFSLLPSGQMRCLSDPDKLYDLEDVIVSLPITLTIPATLYLITTKDGLYKGTLLDWEY